MSVASIGPALMRPLMSSAAALRAVETDDLEEYPFPRGTRLESHSYFQFHYDRWLESDFYTRTARKGDWDVQGLAVAIWCKARKQDPVGHDALGPVADCGPAGSLPADLEGFLRRDPSPLYGWRLCRVGSEVRLMHGVVTEVVAAAIGSRNKNARSRGGRPGAQALTRLRRALKDLGFEAVASRRNTSSGSMPGSMPITPKEIAPPRGLSRAWRRWSGAEHSVPVLSAFVFRTEPTNADRTADILSAVREERRRKEMTMKRELRPAPLQLASPVDKSSQG